MAMASIAIIALAGTMINGNNATKSAWFISSSPDNLLRRPTMLRGSQTRAHRVQDGLRIESDPQKTGHHQANDCPFAQAHVRQFPMMRVGSLKGILRKSQTVKSRHQKAQSGDDGEGNVCPIGSEQDEEFAHEISKPWKPKGSHGKN